MKKEIVISGFGGQGGLAIGKNLAEAKAQKEKLAEALKPLMA